MTGKSDVLDMITDSYNIHTSETDQSQIDKKRKRIDLFEQKLPLPEACDRKANKNTKKHKQSDNLTASTDVVINHGGSNGSKRKQSNNLLIDIILNNDKKRKTLNTQNDSNGTMIVDQKSSPEGDSTSDDAQSNSNAYCKWKPGVKLEDCISCGS